MRIATCTTPEWFGGSEILIQLVFAVVTILIALYAFKVYRLSKQKISLLFALGFSTISVSYIIGMLLNIFVHLQISTNDILSFVNGVPTETSMQLSIGIALLHILTMVTGLSLLAYVNIKERHVNVFVLILALSFASILLTPLIGLMFYIITSILLLFIVLQQYRHFIRKRHLNSLFVFTGFSLLFVGTVLLALAHIINSMFVLGYFILLFGYVALLLSLVRVVYK